MRKVLIGLGVLAGGAVVVVAGVLGMASMEPDRIHLERELVVPGTPADAYAHVADLKAMNEWSPWVGRDPTMKQTYSDTTSGVGSWYEWDGNDDVGRGRMTVLDDVPEQKVVHELAFLHPFEAKAMSLVTIEPQGDDVRVVWAYEQDQDLPSKVFTLFVDMETLLGPDYERGMANLKPLIEQTVAERVEAERRRAEQEAVEADAPGDAD
jgi:hypothetical protein